MTDHYRAAEDALAAADTAQSDLDAAYRAMHNLDGVLTRREQIRQDIGRAHGRVGVALKLAAIHAQLATAQAFEVDTDDDVDTPVSYRVADHAC